MKISTIKSKHHQGFTLIEFLVIVIIAGLLLALAAPRITDMYNRYRETTIKNDVSMLRQAAASKKGTRSTYTGVACNDLVTDEYISNNWTNCNGVNPFNGNYTVGPNGSDARNVDIGVTNLGTQSCNRLEQDFADNALNAGCSGGSLTVTFEG